MFRCLPRGMMMPPESGTRGWWTRAAALAPGDCIGMPTASFLTIDDADREGNVVTVGGDGGSAGGDAPMRPTNTSANALARVNVTHIVSDVDGTLLDSWQVLTATTQVAIARAAARGVPLILATGKSRGPWVTEVTL